MEQHTKAPDTKTETTSQAATWLEYLRSIKSAHELTEQLQSRYSAIVPDKLQEIIVFGAAAEGQRLVALAKQYGINVVAWLDDNPALLGQTVHDTLVASTAKLTDLDKNIPVILATHRVLAPYVKSKDLGFKHVAPFALLQLLDGKLFAPHMFYENWYEDLVGNYRKICQVAELLADDYSQQVLNAILGFRLTLNPLVLEPIIEWDLYGPENLISYSDNEVYIDGGSFDGDSIRLFINRVNNKFERIIGFEPDTNTYQKLVKNFADDARVCAVNKGLYSHDDTLYFDNAGTRGSIFTADDTASSISLPVTSIDNYLNGERVSFIKMNIEGAEMAALYGAECSIKNHLPTLGISIYHKAADIWEIPLLVQSFSKKYKLYFRQHDGGVIESVLYAIAK